MLETTQKAIKIQDEITVLIQKNVEQMKKELDDFKKLIDTNTKKYNEDLTLVNNKLGAITFESGLNYSILNDIKK